MKPDRAEQRARDVKAHIQLIRDLLTEKSYEQVLADPFARAAFERFLEIISEASRHLPDAWKSHHSDIPWRRIADLGNVTRHAYSSVDLSILWAIYERDLDPLEAAIDAMLAAHEK